jgi:hypothetical protein
VTTIPHGSVSLGERERSCGVRVSPTSDERCLRIERKRAARKTGVLWLYAAVERHVLLRDLRIALQKCACTTHAWVDIVSKLIDFAKTVQYRRRVRAATMRP